MMTSAYRTLRKSLLLSIYFIASNSWNHASATPISCEDLLELQQYLSMQGGPIAERKFNVRRNLNDYYSAMPGLRVALARLGEDSLLLDFGEGEGRARLEYLTAIDPTLPSTRATTLGVSMDPVFPRSLSSLVNQSKYASLRGRLFESIPDHEFNPLNPNVTQGFVDVGMDYFGVFSYTWDLSGSLSRMLRFLKPGSGLLFIHTSGPRHPNATWITTKAGHRVSLVQWLRTIPGLRSNVINSKTGEISLILQKDAPTIIIPDLKLQFPLRHGMPLGRDFVEL